MLLGDAAISIDLQCNAIAGPRCKAWAGPAHWATSSGDKLHSEGCVTASSKQRRSHCFAGLELRPKGFISAREHSQAPQSSLSATSKCNCCVDIVPAHKAAVPPEPPDRKHKHASE